MSSALHLTETNILPNINKKNHIRCKGDTCMERTQNSRVKPNPFNNDLDIGSVKMSHGF